MPLSDSIQFSSRLKEVVLSRQNCPDLNGHGMDSSIIDAADKQKEDFEKLKKQAYQKGLEEGKAIRDAELKSRTEELGQQLQAMITLFHDERQALSRDLENLLPELIIESVGRILYGLQPDGETVKTIVASLLEDFDPEDSQMRLLINPVDLDTLMKHDGNFFQRFTGLRLIADDKLHRGECHLDSRFGVTDARFSAKLASLRKVLE